MASQIQAMNRTESNMAAQLRQWSFPVVVLSAWVAASVFCLSSLNGMSATWSAVRSQSSNQPAARYAQAPNA